MDSRPPRPTIPIDAGRLHAALGAVGMARGEWNSPNRVIGPTMNANDGTPCNGESVSDASVDYQNIGQRLLYRELERHAYAVRESFMAAAVAVERGDDLDAGDVVELEEQLEQAQYLVESLREALE